MKKEYVAKYVIVKNGKETVGTHSFETIDAMYRNLEKRNIVESNDEVKAIDYFQLETNEKIAKIILRWNHGKPWKKYKQI